MLAILHIAYNVIVLYWLKLQITKNPQGFVFVLNDKLKYIYTQNYNGMSFLKNKIKFKTSNFQLVKIFFKIIVKKSLLYLFRTQIYISQHFRIV